MKRIYVDKSKVNETIAAINKEQAKRSLYINVTVKPYHGKKYDPQNTVVIIID